MLRGERRWGHRLFGGPQEPHELLSLLATARTEVEVPLPGWLLARGELPVDIEQKLFSTVGAGLHLTTSWCG
jgi:hypothetical protein